MGNLKTKTAKLWQVNIVSFVLFSILATSGLINTFVLPRGFRGEGGFLFSLRHFLIGVHAWAALAFIFVIGIHLFLHWPYIRSHLNKEKNWMKRHRFNRNPLQQQVL